MTPHGNIGYKTLKPNSCSKQSRVLGHLWIPNRCGTLNLRSRDHTIYELGRGKMCSLNAMEIGSKILWTQKQIGFMSIIRVVRIIESCLLKQVKMSRRRVVNTILGVLLLTSTTNVFSQNQKISALSLEDLMKIDVQTASLHPQSVNSAPGLVTVITAEQIRKYGYQTFGEALNHVVGFYLTDDRTYDSVGIDGFSIPGDWATRTLVLINGHAMTENIFGSANYFGDDFALDLSLVDHIEIVRGPSSSLYGSNGILATINVITKSPGHERETVVRVETNTLAEKKLTISQIVPLSSTNTMLLSGTVFNTAGLHSIYIHEYDSPATNNGNAVNMDGSRGFRFFANIKLGKWEFLSLATSREKIQPISWGDAVFNDRGTRATDQRAFIDAQYTRESNSGATLHWRTFYDRYQFHGDYRYPLDENKIVVNRELDAGDWIASEVSYRFPWLKGDLTTGSALKFDLRALQSTADIQPIYKQNLYVNKLDEFAAGFIQQEWSLGEHWSFNIGARYDWSYYRSSSISPRAAVVFQPDTQTSIKLLYGRGFRNPNANELFFDDGKQNLGNLRLRPERADTFQIAMEHNFDRIWTADLSIYNVNDKDVIVPVYSSGDLIQFQNAARFHGWGIGLELAGTLFSRVEMSTSFQKQKANLAGSTAANSPGDIGKLQFSTPFWNARATLSGGLLYISERRSLAGARLPSVYLPEATVSAKLRTGLQLQGGVRNITNSAYSDPVGLTADVDTLRQPGRTFFFTVNILFGNY